MRVGPLIIARRYIYICTRAADAARLRPLVRLFLAVAMQRLLSAELRFDEKGRSLPAWRHKVLFLLDEFASLGKCEAIELGMSKSLGFGVSAVVVTQDLAQLHRSFGPNEGISVHCNVRAAMVGQKAHSCGIVR